MLLLIDVVLLALAWIISRSLRRAGRDERRQAEADAAAKLTEAGLGANGDLLGAFNARPLEGVDVVVKNRQSQTRPGASEPTGTACIARVEVALEDQIVCKVSEADLVMGPLPAVPRVRTGHAPFDEAYTVFVGSAGGAPSGSYRAAPVAGGASWAQPPILEALLELDLLWLRVQEGRAELAFPPLEVEDVARAVAIAIAIEHAAIGRPYPALARGPRTLRPPWRDVGNAVGEVWGAGLLFGIAPVGVVLSFVPPLRNLNAEIVCGPGDRIVTVSAGDGATLECANHPEKSLILHWLSGGLLGLGVVVLIGLFLTIASRRRVRSASAA